METSLELSRLRTEALVFGGIGAGTTAMEGFHIPLNYWVLCVLWAVALYCAGDILWRSPLTPKFGSLYRIPITVALIALYTFVAFVGYKNTHTQIAPQFSDTYYRFLKGRLGKPEQNAVAFGDTDETRLQLATALWAIPSFDYVLWDGVKKWEYLGETTPPPRERWHDPTWTREHLHMDSGGPPIGDLAYAWDQLPEYWKRMGTVQWKCTEKHTVYQDFEHGRLIGIFRGTLYSDAGIIFALFDDYRWESIKVTSGVVQFDSAATSDCKYWDSEHSTFLPVK